MATRPSTLDVKAFSVSVSRNVGDQCVDGRAITRASSLPAVACRRHRRRIYRRPLSVRAGSSPYTCLHDRNATASDIRPEVEFSPRVDRSWSMANIAQLSSSAARDSVFRCGSVTAATSFQTCVDEEEEDPAVSTSSIESEPPAAILEEPPRGRPGCVDVQRRVRTTHRHPRGTAASSARSRPRQVPSQRELEAAASRQPSPASTRRGIA